MDKFIVIVGNPGDGFDYHGTFDNEEDAATWAERDIPGGEWWVVKLNPPEEEK